MFTWICPQCGREVPPAYTDCPDCAEKAAKGGIPAPPPAASQNPLAAAPPPPPEYPASPYMPTQQQPVWSQQPGYPQQPVYPQQPAYPPQQPTYPPQEPTYQPQQPTYPPQQPHPQQAYPPPGQSFLGQVNMGPYQPPPPPARRGLPTWLMTIVFTLAFLGLVGGIYWLIGYMKGGGAGSPSATVESPAAKPGAKQNPYQKFIEISGVRFTVDAKKKPVVKFVVINHSGADILGLAGNVTIWGRTQKSEEEAAGTFSFKADVGPFSSKDLSAPLNTKLPMVQLPDWQNVSTDIQITAPGS